MTDSEQPRRETGDEPNRAAGVGKRDHGGMGLSSERDELTPGLVQEVDSREDDHGDNHGSDEDEEK